MLVDAKIRPKSSTLGKSLFVSFENNRRYQIYFIYPLTTVRFSFSFINQPIFQTNSYNQRWHFIEYADTLGLILLRDARTMLIYLHVQNAEWKKEESTKMYAWYWSATFDILTIFCQSNTNSEEIENFLSPKMSYSLFCYVFLWIFSRLNEFLFAYFGCFQYNMTITLLTCCWYVISFKIH